MDGISPDGVVIKDFQVFILLEIRCPDELINTTNEILFKKCKFLYAAKNILHVKKSISIMPKSNLA